MVKRCFFICCLLLFAAASCNQPVATSEFKELSLSEGWVHSVTFHLQLTDTIHSQEITISARFINNQEMNQYHNIPLIVRLISPSNNKYADTLVLPLRVINNKINDGNGISTISWPYRKGIQNKEPGNWQIILVPNGQTGENTIYQNITGLGILCIKETKRHER